tara:strand:- start:13 stop:192 length:180 start_codon:yes stop_codon:yes gene_type:complete
MYKPAIEETYKLLNINPINKIGTILVAKRYSDGKNIEIINSEKVVSINVNKINKIIKYF